MQPSVIINGFLRLPFFVEVAHEHMAAIDADLDENSKANWLNCLQMYIIMLAVMQIQTIDTYPLRI